MYWLAESFVACLILAFARSYSLVPGVLKYRTIANTKKLLANVNGKNFEIYKPEICPGRFSEMERLVS
jgi:hypothetical protein